MGAHRRGGPWLAVALVGGALAAGPARAQPEEPGDPARSVPTQASPGEELLDPWVQPGRLSYGSADGATVRVFSVGSVGVDSFEARGYQVQMADPRSGHGTGFLVASGLVLTAQHVVDGARHVVVRLPGEGGFFGARVAWADKDSDVALLVVDADVPALRIAADAPLRVRQTVYAIGYPFDPSRTQPQSARGIVAGQLDDGTLQLDMALNPGNSGGPLLDEQDRVVGMVTARFDPSTGAQGIGFAVPAGTLKAATAAAQARIAAGEIRALSATDRLSATVVDELIQQGALMQLRKAGDLKGGLQSAGLESALRRLTARVRDPDLLVFIAGSLWNGALALEIGGARKVGTTVLTDQQAYALGARLRSAAIDACQRAARLDPAVRGRSPFVGTALAAYGGGRPDVAGAAGSPPVSGEPRDLGVSGRIMSAVSRSDSGRVAFGLGLSGAVALRPLEVRRGDLRLVPFLGLAIESLRYDGEAADEVVQLAFIAAELGLAAQVGQTRRHLEISLAYAPSRYFSALDVAGEEVAASNQIVLLHARASVAYRIEWFHIGASARLLDGTAVWVEPVFVGFSL